MHFLMLVTLGMHSGATSEDARFRTYGLLSEDDSFCGDGGRFATPLCDWFVIGGRWSGWLKETLLGEPYKAAFDREFPELAERGYWSDLVEKNRQSLNQLWREFGGIGDSPVTRASLDHLGLDDDAMPVNRDVYDRFLAPHAGSPDCIGGDSFGDYADLDRDNVDESFIGRKWLVVVDYHN